MSDVLMAGESAGRSQPQGMAEPFQIARLANHGGHVEIVWGDGHRSLFHAIWLRDNCTCADCHDPDNGQRRFDITALPADLSIADATAESANAVTFTYAPGGHVVRLDASWLRAHCYSQAGRRQRRDTPQLWGGELADALPKADYDDICASRSALAGWLENVSNLGFALLHGVPLEDGAVARVAELFGFVRETNYGRVFDVMSKSAPNNLAFTNQALGIHTDNPYRHPSPGLQLLHCLAASAGGGETILVDGFRAAERLRRDSPEYFALLSTHEVPFHFQDAANDLRARSRLISTDPDGAIRAVRYNNRSTAALDLPADVMAGFYAAYRHFGMLLRAPEAELGFRLAPGDLVIMDNHRVLHGRRQFGDDAGRHLQGCYADWDALDSFLRINKASRDETG